jgi:hypothetical protein
LARWQELGLAMFYVGLFVFLLHFDGAALHLGK